MSSNASASAFAAAHGMPVIVFLKQHDSHFFNDRNILCQGEVKVGRAVARLRPSPTNAIFDCKVLSRSHAVIIYEDKKFILRDTNSSNGTFVNNVRITKESESQLAEREIFSNDFIRFGVEVVENGTNHGCIITQVKLYHPNGAEALPKDSFEPVLENLSHEQLFQLACHVNESMFREQTINKKLGDLKALLEETRNMSKKSWAAMLNEERLLDKLELYESQLQVLKQNLPEDSLHSKLLQAFEEKSQYEQNSKAILEQRLEEKTRALLRVTELEASLADSEREAKRLRESLEVSQDAYQSVANNLEQKLKDLESLDKELIKTTDQKEDLESRLQTTTEKYHALKEDVVKPKPAVMQHKTANTEMVAKAEIREMKCLPMTNDENCFERMIELEQESQRLIGLIRETENSEEVVEVRRRMMLADWDEYICVQDQLYGKERSLVGVLEATSSKVNSLLLDGANQLTDSTRFARLLQDELKKLEEAVHEMVQAVEDELITDEADVSSSERACKQEEVTHTLDKVKLLAVKMALAQTKGELSLHSYFDSSPDSHHQQLLHLESREDADGRSDYVPDANEPGRALSLEEKLNELGACGPVAKMTESQLLEYQRRLVRNQGGAMLESPVPAYSMVSSSFSGMSASDSDLGSLSNGGPIAKVSVSPVKSCPISAPEEDDDLEAAGEEFQGPDLRQKYVLVRRQLDATKHDLANLQDAYRRQKEENAEIRQRQLESASSAGRLGGEGANRDETVARDYERLGEKMKLLEQELQLGKRDYLAKEEELRQMRKELLAVKNDREELRAKIQNVNSCPLPSTLSEADPDAPRPSVISNLTAMAAVPVMILLLAIMFSILSQFSK